MWTECSYPKHLGNQQEYRKQGEEYLLEGIIMADYDSGNTKKLDDQRVRRNREEDTHRE